MFIHRRVGWSKEPPNDALVSMWIVQVRSFRAVEKKVFSSGRVNIRKVSKDAENIERERKGEESLRVEGGGDSQRFNYHGWGLGCCHYVTHINEEDRSPPVLLFILFKGTMSTLRTFMFCKAGSTLPLTLPILQKCGIAGSTPVKLEGLI